MGMARSGQIEDYLRQPRVQWMKSAYAIEATPRADREQIEAALLFRGAIVSAHGYIETSLAEFALRCSIMPEYLGLSRSFPYNHKSRLKYFQKVFSKEPLKPYGPIADKFLIRFDAGADRRHLMAHARMVVSSDWIVFEDFKTGEQDTIFCRRTPFTLRDLERSAWDAVCLSRICQRLAGKLAEREILPPLEKLQRQ